MYQSQEGNTSASDPKQNKTGMIPMTKRKQTEK